MDRKHIVCFGDSNTHGYCGDAAEAALHRELLDHIRARDEDAAADCAERLLRIGMDALGMKYRK